MTERLFDQGANLNISAEQLETMQEIESVPDQALYLGIVYDENSQRYCRLYRLDDEVVKLRAMTGYED